MKMGKKKLKEHNRAIESLLFDIMDVNNDGFISPAEFEFWFKVSMNLYRMFVNSTLYKVNVVKYFLKALQRSELKNGWFRLSVKHLSWQVFISTNLIAFSSIDLIAVFFLK